MCVILDGLSLREAARLCLRASKRLAARRGGDAAVWTQQVTARARAFLPASAFFRGPRNATCTYLEDRSMASIFAGASAAADAKVSQVLASAGPALSGAVWTHDNQHIKYCGFLPEVLASSVVVPGRATLADLARFSAATACDVCHSGSAERQCAACQDLLCAQCAVRCALDVIISRGGSRPHRAHACRPSGADLRLRHVRRV